jgi:type II secretory pathway pseudopilin PulG
MSHSNSNFRTAFTLVEAVVAVAITGGMLAAGLTTISATAKSRAVMENRVMALEMAQELMDAVRAKPYEDPTTPGGIGVDAGEVAGDPTTFDDVDDFNGYTESAVTDLRGRAVSGRAGWSRSVAVVWADPLDPMTDPGVENGLKMIVVKVKYGKAMVIELCAVRTRAWDLRSP